MKYLLNTSSKTDIFDIYAQWPYQHENKDRTSFNDFWLARWVQSGRGLSVKAVKYAQEFPQTFYF